MVAQTSETTIPSEVVKDTTGFKSMAPTIATSPEAAKVTAEMATPTPTVEQIKKENEKYEADYTKAKNLLAEKYSLERLNDLTGKPELLQRKEFVADSVIQSKQDELKAMQETIKQLKKEKEADVSEFSGLDNTYSDYLAEYNRKQKDLNDVIMKNEDIFRKEGNMEYFIDGKEMTYSEFMNYLTTDEATDKIYEGKFNYKINNDSETQNLVKEIETREKERDRGVVSWLRGAAGTMESIKSGVGLQVESLLSGLDLAIDNDIDSDRSSIFATVEQKAAAKAANKELEERGISKESAPAIWRETYLINLQKINELKAASTRGLQPIFEQTVLESIAEGDLKNAGAKIAKMSIESLPYMAAMAAPEVGVPLIYASTQAENYYRMRGEGVSRERALAASNVIAAVNVVDSALEGIAFSKGIKDAAAAVTKASVRTGLSREAKTTLMKEAVGAFAKEMPTEFGQGFSESIMNQWAQGGEINVNQAIEDGVIESLATLPTSALVASPRVARVLVDPIQTKLRVRRLENGIMDIISGSTKKMTPEEKKILREQANGMIDELVALNEGTKFTSLKATKNQLEELKQLTIQQSLVEKALNSKNVNEETKVVLKEKAERLQNKKQQLIKDINDTPSLKKIPTSKEQNFRFEVNDKEELPVELRDIEPVNEYVSTQDGKTVYDYEFSGQQLIDAGIGVEATVTEEIKETTEEKPETIDTSAETNEINDYIQSIVTDAEQEIFEGSPDVDNVLNRMDNAEYINDNEIDNSIEKVFKEIDRINALKISDKAKSALTEKLYSIAEKLDNYEFRTKTKTVKTTKGAATEASSKTPRNPKQRQRAEEFFYGEEVVFSTKDSKDNVVKLENDNGSVAATLPNGQKVVFDTPSMEVIDIKENDSTEEEAGGITVTVKDRFGNEVKITGDRAYDIAIRDKENKIGVVPMQVFEEVYSEIEEKYIKENAVQERKTKKVDVGKRTTDSEKVGERKKEPEQKQPKEESKESKEEKVVSDEEKTAIAKEVGTKLGVKASGIKSLLSVMTNIFGLNKKQAEAAAAVGDAIIGTMAKRAGITKEDMYKRISYERTTYKNLMKKAGKLNSLLQKSNAVFETRDGIPIGFNYDTDKVARERFDIPNLEKIGSGSDRDVYLLPDGKVLKVAKTARGLEQNLYEGDGFLSFVPKMFESGLNYVVVENIPRAKSTDKIPVFDENGNQIGESTVGQMIKDLSQFTQSDFDKHNNKLQSVLYKYGLSDITSYETLYNDFSVIRNWGYKDGNAYHIDGGTFGGVQMLERYRGVKNLSDPDFREVYQKSREAKKKFKDTDKNTMYQLIYHSGDGKLTEWDPSKFKGGARATHGWGMYFSSSAYKAKDYGRVKAVFDDAQFNYFNLDDKVTVEAVKDLAIKLGGKDAVSEYRDNIYFETGNPLHDVFLRRLLDQEGKDFDTARKSVMMTFKWNAEEAYAKMLVKAGYDAVSEDNGYYFVIINGDKYNEVYNTYKGLGEMPTGVKFQVDAWHGSPNQFDKFSLEHIGKGEGVQAFGWGLYFTDLEGIARYYAKKLTRDTPIIWHGFLFDGTPGSQIIEKYKDNFIIRSFVQSTYKYDYDALEYVVDEKYKAKAIAEITSGYWGKEATDAMKKEALDFIENTKIKKNRKKATLYKVSLQKDKTSDQYTWLEWHKPLSNYQIDLIASQAKKEGIFLNVDLIKKNKPDGNDIYRELGVAVAKNKGIVFEKTINFKSIADKEASLFLLRAGIDGIRYPAESISRGATYDDARGFNYVVFNENAISIEEVIKFQKDAIKARGAMMMASDVQAIVFALENPNVTTPLHELAHVYEHYLTDSERNAILKWTGHKTWTVETSEAFARGFEKYLSEGVAPTLELQRYFDNFKNWLLEIYNGIIGSEIDFKLNSDMKVIYDQMLGSEEATIEERESIKMELSEGLLKFQLDNNLGQREVLSLNELKDIPMQDIIDDARLRDYSDPAIKYLLVDLLGYPAKKVNEALKMKVGQNEVPSGFTNIKAGAEVGAKLFNRVVSFMEDLILDNDINARETNTSINKKVSDFRQQQAKTYKSIDQINDEADALENKLKNSNLSSDKIEEKVLNYVQEQLKESRRKKFEADEKVNQYAAKLVAENEKKPKRKSMSEIMDETLEFLENQPEFINEKDTKTVKKKATGTTVQEDIPGYSNTQLGLISGLQTYTKQSPSLNLTNKIKEARKAIKERARATKGIVSIRAKLGRLIINSIPKSTYSNRDVKEILTKVGMLTESNVDVVLDEVVRFIVKKNVKILSNELSNILDKKYSKIESGRLKGKSISVSAEERIDRVKSLMNVSMKSLMEKLDELNSSGSTDFDKIADLELALAYNEMLLMDNDDSGKVEALNEIIQELENIIINGKTEVSAEKEADNERIKKMREDTYFEITGKRVDFEDKETLEKQYSVATNRRDRKKTEGVIKNVLRGLSASFNNMFNSHLAIDGLMDLISKIPGKLFGGKLQELVTDRLDEAIRTEKSRTITNEAVIQEKLKKVYGDKWRKKERRNRVKIQTGIFLDKEAVDKAKAAYDADKTNKNRIAYLNALKDNELILSQGDMAYYYNLYKNPELHSSFEKTFGPDYERVMKEITDKLTPEKKEIADWQTNELYPSLYDRYNEVYKKLYGTNMPRAAFYAGKLYREADSKGDVFDAQVLDILDLDSTHQNLFGASSTKSRKKVASKILPMNDMDVMATYLSDMEHFAAMAIPLKEISQMFSNRYIKNAIVTNDGELTYSLINNAIKSIAKRNQNNDLSNKIINTLNQAFVIGRIAISPVIMVKQLVSVFTYANDIGAVNWMKYSLKNMDQVRSVYKELRDNSVYMQDRNRQSVMRAIETFSDNTMREFVPSPTKDFFINLMMFNTKFGDAAAIYIGGMPNYLFYKDQYRKNNPNATEQEVIDYAVRKFEKDTKRTQQSSDLTDKDVFQSGNPYARAFNMFLTSPRQYLRKEIIASRNLWRKLAAWDRKAGKGSITQNVRTLVMYHVFMPTLFQYISMGLPGLLRDWRDDDDEDLLRAALIGNLNSLFIIGDVIGSIADLVTDKPYAFDSSRNLGIIQLATRIGKLFKRAMDAQDPEARAEKMQKAFLEMISLTGIPAPTLARMVDNYSKLGEGDFGEDILRLFNWSEYQIKGPQQKQKSQKTLQEQNDAYERDNKVKASSARSYLREHSSRKRVKRNRNKRD